MSHIPVLLNEVLQYLLPSNGDNIIDATFGYGGHTTAILEQCSNCNVLAIDRDPDVVSRANQIKQQYKDRFNFIHGKFSEVLNNLNKKYNKILFDFGVSSMQLDNPDRGFSFSKLGNVDMRMSKEGKSAYDVINNLSQEELAEIIWKYGEESKSRSIAKAIVKYRNKKNIETTEELRNIIVSVINNKHSHIDAATKTFQALRIYVNDELNEIYKALNSLNKVLVNNSIIVTISFHSLEDRIVKQWSKNNLLPKKLIKQNSDTHPSTTCNTIPMFNQNTKQVTIINVKNSEILSTSQCKISKNSYSKTIESCNISNQILQNYKLIPINKHIVKPSIEEIKNNPRSRSAILRAYRYINYYAS